MTRHQMVAAFNEWMRRYIEEPERFMRDIQNVRDFLAAEGAGAMPSYGEECTTYLEKVAADIGGGQ